MKDNKLKGSDIAILTGVREQLSLDILNRLRHILASHDIVFGTAVNTLFINGVRIRSYPSTINSLAALRGQENISIIYCSEVAFFDTNQNTINEVLSVLERYAGKSGAILLLESTPNKIGDLLHTIFTQDFQTSFYKTLKLSYEWGIGKIYSDHDIAIAKASNSFEREYNLKFSGLEGNVLSQQAIDGCISTGEKLNETAPIDDWSIQTQYVMSIDIGWGSSATAIMVSRFVNGKVQIIYSREFGNRPLFQDILDEVWRLKRKCNGNLKNILMDASATELYTALCNEFNQNPSLQYLRDKQAFVKKVYSQLERYLFIVPIAFGSGQGKTMLNHTQRMLSEKEDDGTAIVGIHRQFEDLIFHPISQVNTSCDKVCCQTVRLEHGGSGAATILPWAFPFLVIIVLLKSVARAHAILVWS